MNTKNKILGITSEASENLVKNVLLNTTENILEDIIKALPMVNSLKGIYQGFTQYQLNKRAQQFLYFVEECENKNSGNILKIFKDKNNIEMGMEIINALDTSYLVNHAQMLARVTLLYDAKEISREKFLEYIHVIPRLTSHLLTQIKYCYEQQLLLIAANKLDDGFVGGNFELVGYKFLSPVPLASNGFKYTGTTHLIFFYEKIYQNSNGKY